MNPHRDKRGRFTTNPTARAMRHIRWLWQLAEWKAMTAANEEGPGDEPAAA